MNVERVTVCISLLLAGARRAVCALGGVLGPAWCAGGGIVAAGPGKSAGWSGIAG